MEFIKQLLQKEITKRILIFVVLGLVLYILRRLINMFLLTFIFTYLLYSAQAFLIIKLRNVVKLKQKIVIVFLYVVLLGFIGFLLYSYIPMLINESKSIIKLAAVYYENPEGNPIAEYVVEVLKGLNISDYIGKGVGFIFKSLSSLTKLGIDLLISLVLSLFFLLEKHRILRFTTKFEDSKIAGFYKEIKFFGQKFLMSFGKVIQAQVLIAFVNSILSVIVLAIMGFPHLPFLGAMIFVLGLIPVAGVIISLIPLSIIAFNLGGFMKVLYVLIMIAGMHALESYVLNPKLVSSKVNLPVFYTFLILLVSETLMGIWGLIIGIPIFMFLLDLIGVNNESGENKV